MPTIVLAVIIYISFTLANMYGVACAALGMLGTLATGTSRLHTRCVMDVLSILDNFSMLQCAWLPQHFRMQ